MNLVCYGIDFHKIRKNLKSPAKFSVYMYLLEISKNENNKLVIRKSKRELAKLLGKEKQTITKLMFEFQKLKLIKPIFRVMVTNTDPSRDNLKIKCLEFETYKHAIECVKRNTNTGWWWPECIDENHFQIVVK